MKTNFNPPDLVVDPTDLLFVVDPLDLVVDPPDLLFVDP